MLLDTRQEAPHHLAELPPVSTSTHPRRLSPRHTVAPHHLPGRRIARRRRIRLLNTTLLLSLISLDDHQINENYLLYYTIPYMLIVFRLLYYHLILESCFILTVLNWNRRRFYNTSVSPLTSMEYRSSMRDLCLIRNSRPLWAVDFFWISCPLAFRAYGPQLF